MRVCGRKATGLGHGWVLGSGDGEKERFHLKRWGAGQGGAEIKKLKSRLSDSYLIFFFFLTLEANSVDVDAIHRDVTVDDMGVEKTEGKGGRVRGHERKPPFNR